MATKKKALKKSKLRHAEYYDFQKIQDKLYAESMDGKMFTKLVEIITLPENIKLAYRNIKKNKGSKTAGTDGKTIQHLEKLSEEKLVVLVQRKFSWYVPQSVRRVEIPKDNGKTRPLGIPTIMDRLVQQCVLQVLEPICEAKFHDHSYGFRPNRSQQHAISQVHKNMQLSHLHYVVDIDIKGFFDNVSHGKLLKQLWTLGICDKKLISIISAMLKAEVAGIGFPEKGTPQGGIISPLLSNIVLNELDWWLASQWENIPTQYPFKQTPNRNGSPNHGNKYASLRRSGLKEITCVRYADDFKLHPSKVLERPKVIYNKKTGKFVMWAHVESADYSKACAGVAVSDSPVGPFIYQGSFRPNNAMSRDQTVFVDDDGRAYQFYSSENNATMYISLLTDDYLKPSGRFTRNFVKESREAPAVFK